MRAGRPQREKARRRSAWTGGPPTWHSRGRGEKGRLQRRPGQLVHDPQPAGPVAVGQADALGPVHLPDLVRPGRPGGGGRRPAAARGRIQAGPPQPPLGRAGGRPVAGRGSLPQDRQQPGGPPGRVFPPQLEHGRPARGRLGVRRGRRGVIARPERVGAAQPDPPTHGPDGPRGDAVGRRQTGRRFAAPVAVPELFPDGDGDGAGHGGSSRERRGRHPWL